MSFIKSNYKSPNQCVVFARNGSLGPSLLRSSGRTRRRYIFMKMRTSSLIILLVYASISVSAEKYSVVSEISELLIAGEENKAIELIMKEDKKISRAVAYRTIGAFYRAGEGVEPNEEKAIIFYGKGCEMDDYHSCREKAVLFYKQGNYSEAEKLYLETAKKHNDFASMGNLVDLYRTKGWSGASEEKAQYWLHQIQ